MPSAFEIPQGNFGQRVARGVSGPPQPVGNQVGAAVQQLGGTVAGVMNDAARQEAELDARRRTAEASLRLAKADNDSRTVTEEIGRGVIDGTIDPAQASQQLGKALGKVRESAVDGYSGPERATMEAHFARSHGDLDRGMQGVVLKRRQNDTVATIDQFGEQVSREASRNGPAWAAQKYGALVDFTGDAAGLNEAQRAKLKQSYSERVHATFYEGAAVGALTKGDGMALRELVGKLQGPEGDALEPKDRSQLVLKIHGWAQSVASQDKYDLASRTKDTQAMVLSGVTPPDAAVPKVEEYTAAFGASGQQRWQQEVGNYLRIGDGVKAMGNASAAERAQIVEQAAPTPGVGFAGELSMRDSLVQARKIVEQRIVTDPAAYALQNSPRVQRAASVMQRVMGDPKMPAEDRDAAIDFYARVTASEQLRLGVDVLRDENAGNRPRGPKLLTNAQANAISDQLSNPLTTGAAMAGVVLGLEQAWGKHWPQVYGQLASENKLPPAALVIPNMQNDASRSRMAQASGMKMDDLKALVDPADPKSIRERLLSEFEGAQRTFTAQGADGNKTLATVIGEAEKLALLYRSQGKSVGDASRQAYTEVMGWKYTFADTYRVPNEQNAKDVQAGAEATLRSLIKAGGTRAFAGETPQVIAEDALRSRAMWVTLPDESGLQLALRGADGGVYAVVGADSQPIRRDWAALVVGAKAARTPQAEREQDIEELRRRQQELNPRR